MIKVGLKAKFFIILCKYVCVILLTAFYNKDIKRNLEIFKR